MKEKTIAITPGELAGVGPDLCLQLIQMRNDCTLVLIADPEALNARARKLGLSFAYREWPSQQAELNRVYVLPITADRPVTPGKLDSGNARYVTQTLNRAVEGCLRGEFGALVTGPVHKGVLNDAGIAFTGHTEFIGERCGVEPVMMLVCPGLRVALATTHLPLADVARNITPARLHMVLTILHRELRNKFRIADPRITVCGLNPHAGESGHLGREEIDVIVPVVDELVRAGMVIRGPLPADTAFLPEELATTDAVLAMYHDQGLPVLKHYDFRHAVNVTLGLPFVRTSVDHGTALELAGTGRADPTSLHAALKLALELAG